MPSSSPRISSDPWVMCRSNKKLFFMTLGVIVPVYWHIYLNVFNFDINIGIYLFLLPDDSYFHVRSFPLHCIHLLLLVSHCFSASARCITQRSANHDSLEHKASLETLVLGNAMNRSRWSVVSLMIRDLPLGPSEDTIFVMDICKSPI